MTSSGDGLRDSTKYLMSIPFKFAAALSMVFIIIYSVFRYIELNSTGFGPIHDDLAIYTLLLATIFAMDGLIIMFMEYASKRFSETRLNRYLKKISGS